MFRALWRYRFFIISSIKNDFKSRLVRSKFGFAWLIIQPLVLALIFTLILSQIMHAKFEGVDSIYAYPIYILSGILGWTVMSETITRSLTMFIDNKVLIQKAAIPKIVIPAIVMGQVFIHSILMFSIVSLVVFAIGETFYISWFLFPIIIGVTVLLFIAIGIILGTLNVFFRDIGHLVPILLQLGFWLTPIVYTVTILPSSYQFYIAFNPFLHLIAFYQDLFLYGNSPSVEQWLGLLLTVFISFIVAIFVFKRASQEMVDEL